MFSASKIVARCGFQRCRALLRLNADNALSKLTRLPSQQALLSLSLVSVSHFDFRSQTFAPKRSRSEIHTANALQCHRSQSSGNCAGDQNKGTCSPEKPFTTTSVGGVCKEWSERMELENIPEPNLSVQYIVAHVLGKKTFLGIDDRHELSEQQIKLVNSLCLRRMQHEPVQYIVGGWDFENIELILRPPVYIPRVETEELVGLAAKKIVKLLSIECSGRCLLEFCCGSGAISLALLRRFPALRAVAVDVSPEACSLTEENAQELGLSRRLTIVQGSVADETVLKHLKELPPFDILVSNPPYIAHSQFSTLEPQILLHEDLKAYDGGEDGLDVIRDILRLAPSLLKHKSDILMEIDSGQGEQIKHMVSEWKQADLQFVSAHNDYLGKRFKLLTFGDSMRSQSQSFDTIGGLGQQSGSQHS